VGKRICGACGQVPQPSTLTPHPAPLNPQPSTLNPQPSTLNPHPTRWGTTGGRALLPRRTLGAPRCPKVHLKVEIFLLLLYYSRA